MILHIGTNDSTFYNATEIVEESWKLKQHILEQFSIVTLAISTPTLRTDKANANSINVEVTELLRTCEETVMTHPNIKEEHLDKYGLHVNNIGRRILAKSLLLGAQAIWHAKDSNIKADSKNLLDLNRNDSLMPICQFLKHQIAGSDYTLSGLSGSIP